MLDPEAQKKKRAALEKKITTAFKIFDHEKNNTIDVREVGTVIRHLGLVPTENEIHHIIQECEEGGVHSQDTTSNEDGTVTSLVKLEKFIPVVMALINSQRMKPANEEVLLQAFQVLDSAGKDFLTEEELVNFMSKEGEPFSHDEMGEMVEACVNRETGQVDYKGFINQLVFDS